MPADLMFAFGGASVSQRCSRVNKKISISKLSHFLYLKNSSKVFNNVQLTTVLGIFGSIGLALRKTNEHTIKTLYDKIPSGLVVVGYGAARLVTS